MKDYEVTIKMGFKSNVNELELKKQIENILCGYDVELANILDSDDMYYNKDFEIIKVQKT